jgi:hypothetical protein
MVIPKQMTRKPMMRVRICVGEALRPWKRICDIEMRDGFFFFFESAW